MLRVLALICMLQQLDPSASVGLGSLMHDIRSKVQQKAQSEQPMSGDSSEPIARENTPLAAMRVDTAVEGFDTSMPRYMIPATLPLLMEAQASFDVPAPVARRQIGCLVARWLGVLNADGSAACNYPSAPTTSSQIDGANTVFLERAKSALNEPPLKFGILASRDVGMPPPSANSVAQRRVDRYIQSFDPILKCAVYGVECAVRMATETNPRPSNPNTPLLFPASDAAGRSFLGICNFTDAAAEELARQKLPAEARFRKKSAIGCNTDVDCVVAAQDDSVDLDVVMDEVTAIDATLEDGEPTSRPPKKAHHTCKLRHTAAERNFLAAELRDLKQSMDGESEQRQQAAALSYLVNALHFQSVNRSALFDSACTTFGESPVATDGVNKTAARKPSNFDSEAEEQSALTKFIASELIKRGGTSFGKTGTNPVLQGAQECPSSDMLRVFCVLTGHTSDKCAKVAADNVPLIFRDDQVFPLYFVLNRFLIDMAEIRSQPTANASVVDTMHNASVVEVIGWHRNWVHVSAMWISSSDDARPARRHIALTQKHKSTAALDMKATHMPSTERDPTLQLVTLPSHSWMLQSKDRMQLLIPRGTAPPPFPRRFVVNAGAGVSSVPAFGAVPDNAPAVAEAKANLGLSQLVGAPPAAATLAPPLPYIALQQRQVHGELWLELMPNPTSRVNNGLATVWAKRLDAVSSAPTHFDRIAYLIPLDVPPTDGFCAGDSREISCDIADAYYLDSPNISTNELPTPAQLAKGSHGTNLAMPPVSATAVSRGFSRTCSAAGVSESQCVEKGFCVPLFDDESFADDQQRCSRFSTCNAAGDGRTERRTCRMQSRCRGNRHHLCTTDTDCLAHGWGVCQHSGRCAHHTDFVCLDGTDCPQVEDLDFPALRKPDLCISEGRCSRDNTIVCTSTARCSAEKEKRKRDATAGRGAESVSLDVGRCLFGVCSHNTSLACSSALQCSEMLNRVSPGNSSVDEGTHHCIFGGVCQNHNDWRCTERRDCQDARDAERRSKPMDTAPPFDDLCLVGRCSPSLASPPNPTHAIACSESSECQPLQGSGVGATCLLGGSCLQEPTWQCTASSDCVAGSGRNRGPCVFDGQCSQQPSFLCNNDSHCSSDRLQDATDAGAAATNATTVSANRSVAAQENFGSCVHGGVGACAQNQEIGCNSDADCSYLMEVPKATNASNRSVENATVTTTVNVGPCLAGGHCSLGEMGPCGADVHCLPNSGRCIGRSGSTGPKGPPLTISGLPAGAMNGVNAEDLTAALSMIPADVRAGLPGMGAPGVVPPPPPLSKSQASCINDKCMALLKTFPPAITKFPMCLLCCLLGLCLGGGGPAAALMAALLSVGSTMTATIAALLKAFKLPKAMFKFGLKMPKLPLLPVPPGANASVNDAGGTANSSAANAGVTGSSSDPGGADGLTQTAQPGQNSTSVSGNQTAGGARNGTAGNGTGSNDGSSAKPAESVDGGDLKSSSAGGPVTDDKGLSHELDIGDEVTVHLVAEEGKPWKNGSITGKDPDDPPPDGSVDVYLSNGTTVRLLPLRYVLPRANQSTQSPNITVAGAQRGNASAVNSAASILGFSRNSTAMLGSNLATLQVPTSRAAKIVKEIKVRTRPRCFLSIHLTFYRVFVRPCLHACLGHEPCRGWTLRCNERSQWISYGTSGSGTPCAFACP